MEDDINAGLVMSWVTAFSGIFYLESGTWDSGFRIWDSEVGIQDLGFGIWDLGFGIWDSGSGT